MESLVLLGIIGCLIVLPITLYSRSKKQQRLFASCLCTCGGLVLAAHGEMTGLWAGFMSERSLGFAFLIFGGLGLLGMNVWIGAHLIRATTNV